jgi:hypothetical protein
MASRILFFFIDLLDFFELPPFYCMVGDSAKLLFGVREAELRAAIH